MKLARFHIKKAMSLIDNSSNRYKEMEELLKTNSHKKDTIK
jgi:hypothetical protein